MEEHRHLPDGNRLSILMATILMVYALTPFIRIPTIEWNIVLPGFIFPIRLTAYAIVSFLAAIMAALGADWLLSGHPRKARKRLVQHSFLPALTAWVIGVPLGTIALSPEWWIVFGLGGLLLSLVLAAEYITVDADDIRHAPASVSLIAVAFALYLVLAIALRASGVRLFLLLPGLVLPISLVSLRALHLRVGGKWRWSWAIGISAFTGQLGLALHYWPLSPLAFGLIILGPAFALTSLAVSIEENRSWQVKWIEPGLMLLVIWGLAFLVG